MKTFSPVVWLTASVYLGFLSSYVRPFLTIVAALVLSTLFRSCHALYTNAVEKGMVYGCGVGIAFFIHNFFFNGGYSGEALSVYAVAAIAACLHTYIVGLIFAEFVRRN
ncbi:MAG: hypothetical protein AAB699_01655 [Patescibacteria group bacterium]